MFRIIVGGSFDSAHHLNNYEGKCKNLHGHTWVFQIVLQYTGQLDKAGISVDFKQAKIWVKEIEELFDHKDLNTIFVEENPTAENISRYIYKEIEKKFDDALSILTVRLWETPNNCIEYTEER